MDILQHMKIRHTGGMYAANHGTGMVLEHGQPRRQVSGNCKPNLGLGKAALPNFMSMLEWHNFWGLHAASKLAVKHLTMGWSSMSSKGQKQRPYNPPALSFHCMPMVEVASYACGYDSTSCQAWMALFCPVRYLQVRQTFLGHKQCNISCLNSCSSSLRQVDDMSAVICST